MKTILLLSTAIAFGQSPGTFTATGTMTMPRAWHTATLLNDGKVLIAGGAVTATTELYDPDTGTFTPAANMTTPRFWHTATLLADGRVLIAGGTTILDTPYPTNSAELYDPATGTFASTGNMISSHECHQATLLANGKVLITGGSDPNGVGSLSSELFDPATGKFALAGTYVRSKRDFNSCQSAVSTALADGRALIFWEEYGAELFDPDAGSFAATGSPIESSYNDGLPTATLLMNGKVLVAGGADDGGIHKSTELFDASTGNFAPAGSLSVGHALHSATLLPNGTVLIAGSYLFGGGTRASTDLYDPVRGIFSAGPEMSTARCCHTATLLNDGRVLVAGGNAAVSLLNSGSPTSLAEQCCPK